MAVILETAHLLAVPLGSSDAIGAFQVSGNNVVNFTANQVKTGTPIDVGSMDLINGYAAALPFN
jgi:hypothetical protein